MTSGPRLDGVTVLAPLAFAEGRESWLCRDGDGTARVLHRLEVPDGTPATAVAAACQAAGDTPPHPYLAGLLRVAAGTGELLLLTDHAAGGTLGQLLATRGRLTPAEVVTTVAPVARAMATLHASGTVHGALTPASVGYTVTGRPMVLDLAITRAAAALATSPPPEAGLTPGGLPAPRPGTGTADDVAALGTLCFVALVGSPPESGGLRRDLALLAPGTPEQLRAAVATALDPDPSSRPDAAGFAAALLSSATPTAVHLAAPVDGSGEGGGLAGTAATDPDRPGGGGGAAPEAAPSSGTATPGRPSVPRSVGAADSAPSPGSPSAAAPAPDGGARGRPGRGSARKSASTLTGKRKSEPPGSPQRPRPPSPPARVRSALGGHPQRAAATAGARDASAPTRRGRAEDGRAGPDSPAHGPAGPASRPPGAARARARGATAGVPRRRSRPARAGSRSGGRRLVGRRGAIATGLVAVLVAAAVVASLALAEPDALGPDDAAAGPGAGAPPPAAAEASPAGTEASRAETEDPPADREDPAETEDPPAETEASRAEAEDPSAGTDAERHEDQAAHGRPAHEPATGTSRAAALGAEPGDSCPAPAGGDWERTMVELYAMREQAFSRGDPALLRAAYAPGSPDMADNASLLSGLMAEGARVAGLRLAVVDVRVVRCAGDSTVLRVVDRLSDHEVLDRRGRQVERRPGRGPQAVEVVLARHDGAWRIGQTRIVRG